MKKHERSLQAGLVRYSDIGKEMTLRNANEHRRLAGHLKDLDSQLHNKLVSIHADMMELKTSPYGDKRNKSARLINGTRERSNSDFGLRALTPIPRTLTSARSLNNLQEKQKKSLVLPEINVQQTSLVSNSSCGKTSPRENQARKDVQKYLLQPGLPSVHRPSSLPDLRSVEERCRFSPKTARKTLQNLEPVCPSPLTREKLISIQPFDSKMENNRQEDNSNGQQQQLIVPTINYQEIDNNINDKKQNCEDSNSIFLNSILTKAAHSDDDVQVAPDLASLGFMDFNDVIDKRLRLCQQEIPNEQEMKQVRYLRWGKEEKDIDLVDAVFEKRDESHNSRDQ